MLEETFGLLEQCYCRRSVIVPNNICYENSKTYYSHLGKEGKVGTYPIHKQRTRLVHVI